jgi:hypothetical protein
MAEFDELDGVLRDALQRAAQPGDSTGVADAIRSRVAAGDPGTSVASSTAPGWGGGVWSWMPWVGLIAVGALVGGAVGVSGAVGRPAGDVTVDVPVSIGESAPAHSCVDGPIIGRIAANTRVLAVQRSDDALWVGVRDPGALGGTIWVTLGDVSLDEGMPALDELPVGGACPETVVVVPTEEPTPEPTQEPAPDPAPSDTTGPMLTSGNAKPNPISMEGFPECGPTVAVVSVNATDPSGVKSVTATWSGGTASLDRSGSQWKFSFSEATIGSNDTNYPITLTARDNAGNKSSIVVNVTVEYCLI